MTFQGVIDHRRAKDHHECPGSVSSVYKLTNRVTCYNIDEFYREEEKPNNLLSFEHAYEDLLAIIKDNLLAGDVLVFIPRPKNKDGVWAMIVTDNTPKSLRNFPKKKIPGRSNEYLLAIPTYEA